MRILGTAPTHSSSQRSGPGPGETQPHAPLRFCTPSQFFFLLNPRQSEKESGLKAP